MNFLLHQQRSPGAVVPIPEDLRPLLEEMSREVLRAQPQNVVQFLADYLEERLVRRENRRLAERVVDNVLDHSVEIVALLETAGIEPERAEAAVKCIRQEFHRHFETRTDDERLREAFRERQVLDRLVKECGFSEQEARQASSIIEQAYRTFYYRNTYKAEPQPAARDQDWRQAAKHSLAIYAQTGPTKEQMETAAIRIQAAYRGYYSRKRQQWDQKATLIQRAFRQHQNRKVNLDDTDSEILNYEILCPGYQDSEASFSPSADIRQLISVAVGSVGDNGTLKQPSPNLEEAATLIQSVYRGHRRRVQLESAPTDPPVNTAKFDPESAATLLQSVVRGHQMRQKHQEQQGQTQHEMATLLQSHARGYLVRKHRSRQRDTVASLPAPDQASRASSCQ
ncbi:abnormal spindle-like microcephaly-associated protein homolog [Anopheles aquasalis]|uniref:abnormal spindle-like microcephaly-associated protein homolog n=1 Tax=Anopheles aquasalis TaxID=42839 RepID=UPI00215A0EAB|nr:abnormal spindle-like microcephaly-associated protein homolog [Anopheles aquasalis]